MKSTNKPVAFLIFLLTAGCLIISLMMTRQAGVSSAASTQGKELIGLASVLIHLGIPVFGIASGIADKLGHRPFARGCTVIVYACAAFSFVNALNFVAAERISLTQAHEAEAKAKTAREQAAIDASKKRQDAHTKMVQEQLKWNQGTAKEVDGRKSRNDMVDANAKLIQDYAKTEITVALTDAPKEITVRSEAGIELLSSWTGYSVASLQMVSVLFLITMMIAFETFGWRKAAFLWFADKTATAEPAIEATPLTPVSERLKPKMLSGPKGGSSEKPITIRAEPSAEWRKMLDAVDFPPAGSRHKGPLRPRLDPDIQALRFTCWLAAYGESGDFHTTELDSTYDEFLGADHREETAMRQVKPAMEAIKGKVASRRQVAGTGTVWHVQPPSLEKMKTLLERAKVIEAEPFTVTQVAALPEVKTGDDAKSSSILPFWRSRTAGGGLH